VHDRLGEHVGHFPRNQEELEEMSMHGFPMNLYSVEMSILIRWSQGRLAINSVKDTASPIVSRRVDENP